MTPEQLKASILQYAIQGKLVEQRPEEGTGEELYQKIQKEKQRLIKDGKIKKEKPLAEITDDEIPFDIPESWKWCKFGDLVDYVMGKTPPRAEPIWWKEDVKWVAISDMDDYGYINETKEMVSKKAIDEKFRIISPKGTLLMSFKLTVGRTAILDIDAVHNEAIISIFPYVDETYYFRNYLFYMLPIITQWGNSKNAIKGKTLNSKSIANLLIPLAPLPELQRIVAKIEELLPYVDRYAIAYEKLEQLNAKFPDDMRKSILQYAIQGKLVEQRIEEGTGEELYQKIQEEKQRLIKDGKIKKEKLLPEITDDEIPFDIPVSWKWVRLGSVGYTNIGLTYSPKEQTKDGVIVLRSSNIQNGKMDYDDVVRVNIDIPSNKRCYIGDILICARNGSKRLVGKAAIVDRDGMSFGAFMAIFRSICNPYIIHVINSVYFRNTLLEETGTTTINQITQDMLRNALIPLPPLTEQKRIVEKIEELLPICDRLKNKGWSNIL